MRQQGVVFLIFRDSASVDGEVRAYSIAPDGSNFVQIDNVASGSPIDSDVDGLVSSLFLPGSNDWKAVWQSHGNSSSVTRLSISSILDNPMNYHIVSVGVAGKFITRTAQTTDLLSVTTALSLAGRNDRKQYFILNTAYSNINHTEGAFAFFDVSSSYGTETWLHYSDEDDNYSEYGAFKIIDSFVSPYSLRVPSWRARIVPFRGMPHSEGHD